MLKYKSPLHQTVSTTPTEFWNDSCSVPELTYAIEHGATGATSNPFIVYTVLKAALGEWKERIRQVIVEHPTWDEEQIAQQVYEEVGVRGSKVLLPVFEARKGLRGRLSIQTNPQWYRDADRSGEAGDPLPRFGAQYPGEASRHEGRCRGRRRGHLPRRQHQRHGEFHGPPGHRRGRGGGARPEPPRQRRQARRGHDPGLHDHDRPAGRLAAGRRQARHHRGGSRRAPLGGDRRDQESLRASTGRKATGRVCSPRPTGTTCTGRSSSAAISA